MPEKFEIAHLITGAEGSAAVRMVAAALGDKESRFNFARGEGFDPRDEAHQERVDRLRKAVEAGEVREIEFEATVARTGSCSNHFSFDPADFDRFAAGFKGQPFLRDHLWNDVNARGGTIKESWVEDAPDGGKVMKQRIGAVKKWAMEGLLDGTLDRFSVGAGAPKEITCSICKKDPRTTPSLFGPCHWPGKRYDTAGKPVSGGGQLAEFIMRGQEAKETSTVLVPAFSGTGLSAMKLTASGAVAVPYEEIFANGRGNEGGDEMLDKLRELLGLAADADESAVLEAVKKATGKAETLAKVEAAARLTAGYEESDLLALVMERTSGGPQMVTKLQNELAEVKAAHAVDKAIAAGKVTAAEREEFIRDAKLDLAAFEKVVARRAPVAPSAGEPPPGGGNGRERDETVNELDEEEFGFKFTAKDKPLTEEERQYLRTASKGAINPEIYLKVRREHERLTASGSKDVVITQRI